MKIKIGNKVVEVDTVNGVPTIRGYAEEIKRPDGRQDVIVHVPCLCITAKEKE